MLKHVNLEDFEEEVLNSSKVILVDFFATWCGPCKMIEGILSEIAEEYENKIKVGKVNVDEQNELAIKYQILNVPTIILFKDGKAMKVLVGLQSKAEIEKIINNL